MDFLEQELRKAIRNVENFPRMGISFKDITPIFRNPQLVKNSIARMCEIASKYLVTKIACIESRGFWMGTLLAYELNLPMVPIRKKGKLPGNTVSLSYELEYGTENIEIQTDALQKDDHVLIHDDILATGGTAVAAHKLVKNTGAEVTAFLFLGELHFLNGRKNLKALNCHIESLVVL